VNDAQKDREVLLPLKAYLNIKFIHNVLVAPVLSDKQVNFVIVVVNKYSGKNN